MRTRRLTAIAAAALGVGLGAPASAGGWDDGYCCGHRHYGHRHHGGTVYVHHHIYAPPRYRHIYHYHSPAPRHVHVVHYAPYAYGAGYFAPRRYHRWHWYGWYRW